MAETGSGRAAASVRRRRGPHLERAIRAAVLDLLVERGVGAVTMAAVAARAGTSKPVLYRRWPDRSALLRDSLMAVATENIPHADTGSYREDMLSILRGWSALFASPLGAIGPAIVGAMPHDPDLAQAFQEGLIGWRKSEMVKTLHRGIERGEVRPDVPVEIARELGQAMLWHRFLVTGDPITEDLVVQIVDDVLIPYVGARPDAGLSRQAPSA